MVWDTFDYGEMNSNFLAPALRTVFNIRKNMTSTSLELVFLGKLHKCKNWNEASIHDKFIRLLFFG